MHHWLRCLRTGDSVPLKRVPAWLKRPVCASFGFGGKLVTVTNNKVGGVDATGHATQRDQGIIAIKQVSTPFNSSRTHTHPGSQ